MFCVSTLSTLAPRARAHDSPDFRFLDAQIVDPTRILNLEAAGRPAEVLALTVGFGANFLSVIHAENRLVLTNGSHRAYALRDLGITEVPCLIERVTRRDELELVGVAELTSNPDRFLTASRPPMLKDYFDPMLRKIIDVRKKNRVVTVQFGFSTGDVPE